MYGYGGFSREADNISIVCRAQVSFLFLFRSLVYFVGSGDSESRRRRVDMNCIGYARLHLRAMNCFARLDLRVCMRDGPTGRDRSINSHF